jgi:hypothetical protein
MAIWSFCISSGKSIGSIMAVVTEYGNGIWEWEICRQGEPLPARMRDGPFKSQEIALAAGRIALREVLELSEFDQERCLSTAASAPGIESRQWLAIRAKMRSRLGHGSLRFDAPPSTFSNIF